jgi:hypothetical protein
MIMGVVENDSRKGSAADQGFCGFDEPTYGVLVVLQRGLTCEVSLDITHCAS